MARKRSLVRRLVLRTGKEGGGRNGNRRFRPRRLVLKALAVLLVLWLAACFLVIVEPTVDKPARADAILVLGPPDVDGRLQEGYDLAAAHYAGTLVISVESEQQRQAKHACAGGGTGYRVICFRPNPQTTRGEAEEIGALARRYHWKSVLVVTSKYHVSRARLIVKRCLPGTVLVIAAPGSPSAADWAYQFGYQTAGFARAFLHRQC